MLGSSGTLSGVVTDEAPCSGRWVLTKPQTVEQGEHGQQDQDGRQQVAQAEQVGVIPGVFCRRGGLGLHGAGQLLGVLLRGQGLEQLGHGLDALHRLEPQAVLQNVSRGRPAGPG